jgi:hypothetical protein
MRQLNSRSGPSVSGTLALRPLCGLRWTYLAALVDAISSRARGEFVRVVDQAHFYAFEYPGRKPDRVRFSSLAELAEAT